MTNPRRQVDVVVIGDGPAGSALACACRTRGVEVVLIGPDDEWNATYSTWIDDVRGVEAIGDDVDGVLGQRVETIAVHTAHSVEIARPYGVFENGLLRARLREGVDHISGKVVDVRSPAGDRHRVVLADGSELRARLVVDTSGWPSSFARLAGTTPPAWQTAIGVVLTESPTGDLARPTLMDFRSVSSAGGDGRPSSIGPSGVTTFCYALPVRDGWLVEETVLAARPAVEPIALLARLAARLGRHPDDVLADSVRTEYVRIPLGGSRPGVDEPVVAFGAAAGYVHAATGFSVASSLRAAPRVAAAIGAALESSASVADSSMVGEAVWPAAFRRSRVLHDYGLELLLRLDDDEVRAFFGAFFALPVEQWRGYMRIDTPPSEVAAVMTKLFRASSWSMRRRLMSGNPTTFARLLRP
ncbi:MAG TPA: lycopene cyclase family protein [Ilumatobacteraceae bacterium]|nr:lycopene cyclase family protein [Ilumatobacteraceae bacterium]